MREELLTIETVPSREHVTLRLNGEVDMSSAESVRDAAFSAMQRHATTVHIDLSGVTFMDSTGIQALLSMRRRAELAGGDVRLVDPTRAVLHVLEVTGVKQLFQIGNDDSTPAGIR